MRSIRPFGKKGIPALRGTNRSDAKCRDCFIISGLRLSFSLLGLAAETVATVTAALA
jgi:hypothetical protein